MKKVIPRHIIIKLLKISDKKILKAARGKEICEDDRNFLTGDNVSKKTKQYL